ncbi:hypothetical protein PAXRUDRAFT_822922 [Paxillus rubicundulus Ve08.2h10]|uniref:Uncharacterized protein n=1 Tax=Paxillus rubicundulus Ve08.2h10 TaxID=930991 RepID=A0A0D0E9C9_9AGAM|nr:hypothetical protein PAXRUDRAFT_822922 [Paxillus rubicundulus Ve08.2h10]
MKGRELNFSMKVVRLGHFGGRISWACQSLVMMASAPVAVGLCRNRASTWNHGITELYFPERCR